MSTFALPRLLPGFAAYAEIHHRPRLVARQPLYRRRPEVIFDVPARLAAEAAHLPLLLVVKDAHRFPVRLHRLRVEFAGPPTSVVSLEPDFHFREPLTARILEIPVPEAQRLLRLRVLFTLEDAGGSRDYINDTYPGTWRPFEVVHAPTPFPGTAGYFTADLHFHSQWTADQVEFGAPLVSVQRMMEALELDILAVTDHSYDLDDDPRDYLLRDPRLRRWHRSREEIRRLNARHPRRLLLPGEEVSVHGGFWRTLHLLVLGGREFLPGSGDSGERWGFPRCELTLREALERVTAPELALAAHPQYRPGFLERVLLKRSTWNEEAWDMLTHFQVGNGDTGRGFREGLEKWRAQLLRGRRVVAVAGNDAHGGFNQSRQMALPFLTVSRKRSNPVGYLRTSVWAEDLTEAGILEALHRGACGITTGPLLQPEDQHGEPLPGTIRPRSAGGGIRLVTTAEWGRFHWLRLFCGVAGSEEVIDLPVTSQWEQVVSFPRNIPRGTRYLRLEARTTMDGLALTNPWYFR